jgi:hypothetical protein
MDKIFTGKDRARELGMKNYREMVATFAARNGRLWNGSMDTDLDHALYAYVDAGRWITTCECNESFFVEPSEPFAFCARCGNISNGGKARMVVFPDDKAEIEAELLEREIEIPAGAVGLSTQDVFLTNIVKPKHAPREWKPGITKEALRNEHKKVKEIDGRLE